MKLLYTEVNFKNNFKLIKTFQQNNTEIQQKNIF